MTSPSMPRYVYLVCAVPVCILPSRDVPATFHIDLHFIANPMYYDSDKFEDLIVCCYHTHIYCDNVLFNVLFSCLSLSVSL